MAGQGELITLWTHHTRGFDITARELSIDPTKGKYWKTEPIGLMKRFRYREVLPKLCDLLGTKDFLWCYTVRPVPERMTESDDEVGWELNVPLSHVRTYHRVGQWDNIVYSRCEDWSDLLLDVDSPMSDPDIGALVCVPLPPESARQYKLEVKYPNER